MILAVVAGLPLLFGCADTDKLRREKSLLENQLQVCDKERSRLSERCGLLEAQVGTLEAELKKSKAKERDLNELLAKLQQAQQERESQLKELQALVRDMGGMSVESRPEGDYIVIENAILFAAGKTELSDPARKTLDSTVIAYLKKHPDQLARIDGHTDGVPIQHSNWQDNYHLGAMRALSVMKYLASKGIPAERMYIVGFGPNRPLVKPAKPTADTPKNRRVEILIVPKAHKSIEQILDEFK